MFYISSALIRSRIVMVIKCMHCSAGRKYLWWLDTNIACSPQSGASYSSMIRRIDFCTGSTLSSSMRSKLLETLVSTILSFAPRCKRMNSNIFLWMSKCASYCNKWMTVSEMWTESCIESKRSSSCTYASVISGSSSAIMMCTSSDLIWQLPNLLGICQIRFGLDFCHPKSVSH